MVNVMQRFSSLHTEPHRCVLCPITTNFLQTYSRLVSISLCSWLWGCVTVERLNLQLQAFVRPACDFCGVWQHANKVSRARCLKLTSKEEGCVLSVFSPALQSGLSLMCYSTQPSWLWNTDIVTDRFTSWLKVSLISLLLCSCRVSVAVPW